MQKLKQIFIHKTFWLFITLIVLTGVLGVTTYFHPKVFNQTYTSIKSLIGQVYEGNVFKEKSNVRIWIENDDLKTHFTIISEDQDALNDFNQKLGIADDYLKGVSVTLDQASIKKLSEFVPIELDLKITSSGFTFSNGIIQGFASSLIRESKEYSSGSGKLKLEQYSATEYDVKIDEPGPLLQAATASGKLTMSDKLLPLFPILHRVSTIEIKVNGKSVSGEVTLK